MVEIIDKGLWEDKLIVNPEGFLFDITCMKCSSRDILLEGIDDIAQGSEYTGAYGDADLVIKCKTCGNAYSINVVRK